MIKKITGLFLLGAFSLSAQLETAQISERVSYSDELLETSKSRNASYLFKSYSINLHPVTMLKGYLPLTIEMRLTKGLSIETGPALVTRPYVHILTEKPEVGTNYYGPNNIFLGSGQADYDINLGWETNIKFYFDRDIWESSYFSIFHSYRRTSADLINLDSGLPDIEGHAFYSRNHFGVKYGRRRFLNEWFSSAGDKWVMDSYFGFSYAGINSQNFFDVGDGLGELAFLGNLFVHYGISFGYLTE